MKPREVNYGSLWAKAVNDQEDAVRKITGTKEPWESRACRMGFGIYKVRCFCERLARKYFSPWYQPTDVEAGRLYLINKHHWTPEMVKGVDILRLMMLLHVELAEMRLTPEEWAPVHDWTSHMDCHECLAESAPLT